MAWRTCICLFCAVASLATSQNPIPVRIGVLAKRGSEQCLEQWGPTAEYLTGEIPGHAFIIQPLDHDEIGPYVANGKVDFVLVNPSLYIELESSFGAGRIATLSNLSLGKPHTLYAGVIFRKAGRTDIKCLDDLKGKVFMAVDARSFGGWQMAWRELRENGIDPSRDFAELRFGGTHDAVVYAVRNGEVDAGTVRSDTLERMASENKIRLEEFQVIGQRQGEDALLPFVHSTRTYPEWPFAKARGTSDELAQKVAIALMGMSAETSAARAAKCSGWVIPQNYQPVHDCLKELRVGPYRDYGKVTLSLAVRRYWPWLLGALFLFVVSCAVSVYVWRLNRQLWEALLQYRHEQADRKRTEESLRNSELLRAESEKLAAIGRLAAGVAHEINNPLTSVLGFSHMLRDKENLDEQDKQDLDLIIRETNRASQIVHGLLDFARERPANKEALDINDVVRRTIQLLGSLKARQRITVSKHLKENLPPVDGDANQLQQVLLNLSLNACEAMREGGVLTIGTSIKEQNVLLSVTDTGCGIEKEHLSEIFEPFFTTKPVGQGTGLGLSVSYGIVQQHGGSIEVESKVGEGTTFTIVLPTVDSRQPVYCDRKSEK